jgi:hypothetical protein
MVRGRHLVAVHISRVGWIVPVLRAGPALFGFGQSAVTKSAGAPDPVSLDALPSQRIRRGRQGPERSAHHVSRADRQAGPQGHAKTRRVRTLPNERHVAA